MTTKTTFGGALAVAALLAGTSGALAFGGSREDATPAPAPAVEAPAAPVVEAPATPAVEAPVVEAPAVEAPAETPAVEAPVVEEAPAATEAPAVEAPATEAPAVEAAPAATEAPATEAAAVPATGGATTMYDGVFTAAQAEAGQAAFMASCASCHGNAARGSSGGPRIIGPVINNKYNGKTVWDYYTYTRDNMPMGATNSLSAQTYADIVAFVLSAHGAEPGDTVLPADEAVLSQITMGKKPAAE